MIFGFLVSFFVDLAFLCHGVPIRTDADWTARIHLMMPTAEAEYWVTHVDIVYHKLTKYTMAERTFPILICFGCLLTTQVRSNHVLKCER